MRRYTRRNFLTVLGMFVCLILCKSLCKCTMSNVCGKFRAIAIFFVCHLFFFLLFETCRSCIYCLQGGYSGVFCFESVLVCVAL